MGSGAVVIVKICITFSDIIAHISRSETIYPGEVIGSGPVGTGSGIESGKKLAPGDEFELEIEKTWFFSNKIVQIYEQMGYHWS